MRGALTIIFIIGFVALAQVTPRAIRFEVASIRPESSSWPFDMDNRSFAAYRAGKASGFCEECVSGTHYDYYGAWVKGLIGEAFRIDSRLVVAPDWLNKTDGALFVIHAIMPEGATRDQIPEMLTALLEERFHLVAHLAPAEQTAYSLVAAKNGPKLKPPREMDRSACEPWVASIPPNMVCRTTRERGDRNVTLTMNSNTAFGPMLSEISRGEALEVHIEYFGITMSQLAGNLARDLSTPEGMPQGGSVVRVVDKTGVDGAWYVVVDKSSSDLALSTVSASLEKQGLRLERTTVPAEKLIVDRLDKVPTDN